MNVVDAGAVVGGVPRDLSALAVTIRPATGPTVRVCTVGDIGLSGRATATATRRGAHHLFADVRDVLASADLTLGNLESPLAGEIAPGGAFSAAATGASTLRDAGFDIVHLANNHIGEYGLPGLAATLRAVREAGLQPLGAGDSSGAARELVVTSRNGIRIGWLGCGRTLLPQDGPEGPRYWEFDEQELLERVKATSREVDVLIVSIHIGLMYVSYPRPEHKMMAERLMSAGADVIVMHHAHVLQGCEVTATGHVCCYNLGNFMYDWEEGNVKVPVVLEQQNEGAIFLFDLDREGVTNFTVLPTWIDEECCVRWATGNRGVQILTRLQQISTALQGDFRGAFERERALHNTGGILKVLVFHTKQGHWRFVADSLRRARWEHVKMAARWMSGLIRNAP